MPFTFQVLTTDLLLYVLLAALAGFIRYSLRHDHLRTPWRQVAERPLAMAALVVLCAYLVVGLLDSVHLRLRLAPSETAKQQVARYSPEVLSVLDLLATPLRIRKEKTYSAPLAMNAYSKETIEAEDGTKVRDYPRLRHGGAHLVAAEKRTGDIVYRVLLSMGQGLAIAYLVLMLKLAWRARRKTTPFAVLIRSWFVEPGNRTWRTVWGTVAVVTMLIMIIINVGPLYHLLGTDQVGNDVLYKSLKSVRTGLLIGTLTTLIMLPFAVALGLAAGYFRGWVDDVVQYLYTTLNSIPGVLLVAAAILSLQLYMANHPESFNSIAERSDVRLLFLCVILGITSWTGLCRLVRGETLKLRETDYVQAALALGVKPAIVLMRHVFPNLMHLVLISVVLDFSGLVLAEAVLSYVGIGVDPTMESWGNMINGARLELAREPMVWWSLAAAFLFMFALVLSANLFSDAVRDAFDPRMRQR